VIKFYPFLQTLFAKYVLAFEHDGRVARVECLAANDAFKRFEGREESLCISWPRHGVSWGWGWTEQRLIVMFE
jgi:hypothetical protein